MILADKIIMLRKKNGWSQEELAAKVNVSRQSVSKWEGALSVPELGKVLELSGIFGVSTDFLLKDELGEEDYSAQAQQENSACARRVTMQQANEFLRIKRFTAKRIALAVFMCIVSPIALVILSAVSESPIQGISENLAAAVGLIALLLTVAGAVAIFIFCGMKAAGFRFLDEDEIETEYGVSGMVKARMEKYRRTYTKFNIIGACCCILAAVPLLAVTILSENDLYAACAISATLVAAGIGVIFFTVCGVNNAAMKRLLQEGDYSKTAKRQRKQTGSIGAVYWLVTVAVYLLCFFTLRDWETSWVIWPVAGVLFAAVMTVRRMLAKNDK